MALIPAFYLDAVVSIGNLNNGCFQSQATGFLVGLLRGDKTPEGRPVYLVFLITNKHVFEGKKDIYLRFNLNAGGAKTFCLPLADETGAPKWVSHANTTIDLAAVGINYNNLIREENVKCRFIQEENIAYLDTIRREGITQGDGVFALGFPLGLAGNEKNYVVVKGGVIARLDEEIIKRESSFIIDSNIFPGNSGGPVILKPEVVSIEGTSACSRAYVIGVIRSYIPYEDVAISVQTRKPRVIFNENSGLAMVVPMDFVKEMLKSKLEIRPDTPKQVETKEDAKTAAECS